MKKVTKRTQSITEKGTVINMVVTVSRGWEDAVNTVDSDGWEVPVHGKKVIEEEQIIIEVNGQKYTGSFSTGVLVPEEYRRMGVYAIFADKIALSRDVYNNLNAVCEEARREAETDENWMAYQRAYQESIRTEVEYLNHSERVENMMTLNGRSY